MDGEEVTVLVRGNQPVTDHERTLLTELWSPRPRHARVRTTLVPLPDRYHIAKVLEPFIDDLVQRTKAVAAMHRLLRQGLPRVPERQEGSDL